MPHSPHLTKDSCLSKGVHWGHMEGDCVGWHMPQSGYACVCMYAGGYVCVCTHM